jgi:hypothetical protein
MTNRWVWVGGDLVAIADLDSRSHIKVGSPRQNAKADRAVLATAG